MIRDVFGNVVAGVGLFGVWVNGSNLVPPPCGKPAILRDAHELIYQDGNNQLRSVGASPSGESISTLLDDNGASHIVAENGHWAAYLSSGSHPMRGTRTSWGLRLLDEAPLAIAEGILYTRGFQTPGLFSYRVGETTRTVLDASAWPDIRDDAPQFSTLPGGRLAWLQGTQLRVRGLASPAPTWGVPFDPSIIEDAQGQVWVCYHNDRLYLHPLTDASKGYVFEGTSYGSVAVCPAPHVGARIYAGWDHGETQLRTETVAELGVGMVDLQPVAPPEPVLPAPDIRPFAHFLLEGPFFATGQYGSVDHPGNAEILIRTTWQALIAAKSPRYVVADCQTAPTVPDTYLRGIYWSPEAGNAPYDEARATATGRRVPLYVYSDTDDYDDGILAGMPIATTVPLVRAYPMGKKMGEALKATPAEDVARARRNVKRLRLLYPKVALARTMYTQSGNYPLGHIVEMQPGLADIVRDYQLCADFWFAWLRDAANSASGNPVLVETARRLARAVPRELVPPSAKPTDSEKDDMLKLPARRYVQIFDGNYLTLDLAKPSTSPEVEFEITAAVKTDAGDLMFSPVGSDVYLRMDRAMVRDIIAGLVEGPLTRAMEWKPKSDADADSGWQHYKSAGRDYAIATGDSVDGTRHGGVSVFTLRGKDGQFVR